MRAIRLSLLLLLLLSCAPSGQARSHFRSGEIAIAGVENALNGPRRVDTHVLIREARPRLVWLTGFSREGITDHEGRALPAGVLGELTANLADSKRHGELMRTPQGQDILFALGEGVPRVTLPPGFGLPLMSNEPILVTSTLLNFDPYRPATQAVARGAFDYVYQNGLSRPMVPLRVVTARALVSRQDRPLVYGVAKASTIEHGEGCPVLPAATDRIVSDELGQQFCAEWLLPAGKCTTRTLVTHQLRLPYDSTLHYATAELLAHARRIELRDRTEQRALVTLEVGQSQADGTLARVPVFSSAQGVEMPADHQYELLVTYGGAEGAPALGTMRLYLRDRELDAAKLEVLP